MSIEFILYLCDVAISLRVLALIVIIFFVITCFMIFMMYGIDERIKIHEFIILLKKSLYIIIPCLLILVAIPTQKTMYMIVGAHYLKESDIPKKVELLINKKLDEYLIIDNKK